MSRAIFVVPAPGVRGSQQRCQARDWMLSVSGEKTAVEMVRAAQPDPATRVEQLDMLGLGASKAVVSLAAKRDEKKLGRPVGARNKRTMEMAAFLLSRYTSPLEVLAQMATMDVDLLAKTLKCSKLEALQEKRQAAVALLPYLHSKMPVAVDVTNHKVVHLVIGDLGDAGANDDGADHVTIAGTILAQAQRDDDGEGGSGAPAAPESA